MSADNRPTVECGRTYPKVPVDNIKLNNPFVGKEPFKVTYAANDQPNMGSLMNGEYSRIWYEEHDQYLKKRKSKASTVNYIKPDVNARRPTQKSKMETNELKPMIRCKKYDNVQSKINNGK